MNSYKKMRIKSGLMQIEVSKKLDISNSTVSMWETGKSHPTTEMLPKIAYLYDCTIDELLGFVEISIPQLTHL